MNEFIDKIDALDLVITTLKEHEKNLDEIANRMEVLENQHRFYVHANKKTVDKLDNLTIQLEKIVGRLNHISLSIAGRINR